MTWDSQNRMASCTYAGQTSTFTYGADGLRRRMVTGTNTTDYLLDGQSVVREIKNGVVDATYLNGPRGPEYKRDQNGAVQWYLYDGLGSVVGLVDSSGNVTNTRKYDVYGAPRNAQTGSAHCFVGGLGHTSDAETGLIYMRARYYDPATGRFVSEDSAKDGENWFGYCGGNPVGAVDRSGKQMSPPGLQPPQDEFEWLLLAAAMYLRAGIRHLWTGGRRVGLGVRYLELAWFQFGAGTPMAMPNFLKGAGITQSGLYHVQGGLAQLYFAQILLMAAVDCYFGEDAAPRWPYPVDCDEADLPGRGVPL